MVHRRERSTSGRSTNDERNPFVRRRELRRVINALIAAQRGGGHIIELVGEPGSGKTRLLAEVRRRAESRGLAVVTGQLTGRDERPRYLPLVESLLSRPVEVPRAPEGNTSNGLVVVLDDLHLADTATLEFVGRLTRGPQPASTLVVVSYRPRQACPMLRGALAQGRELGTTTRITLGPLSIDECAQLLGTDVSDPALPGLREDSGGNPLLLLLALRCQEVNGHLTDLLAAELASLDAVEKDVVAAAAVLGDDFDPRGLADVAAIGIDEVLPVIDSLAERDLFRQAGDGPHYSFRHFFLRDVAYRSTNPGWRFRAHRKALAALTNRHTTAEQRAIHIARSPAGPNRSDYLALRQAAEEMLFSAPHSAARFIELALTAVPEDINDLTGQLRSLFLLTQRLTLLGELASSRTILDLILRRVPENSPELRASVIALCTLVECFLGRYQEATARLEAELAALGPTPPVEAAHLIIIKGVVGILGGPPPNAFEAEWALELARENGDRVTEAGARAIQGLCQTMGSDPHQAIHTLRVCATQLDELTDGELRATPEYLALLAWAEDLLGNFDDAERHFSRGVTIARGAGQLHILPILLCGLSDTRRNQGRLDDAQQAAEAASQIASEIDGPHLRGLAHTLEALSNAWRRGRRALNQATLVVEDLPLGSCRWAINAALALALTTWLEGDAPRCIATILEAAGGPDLKGIPLLMQPMCFELLTAAAIDAGNINAAHWARHAVATAALVDLPGQRGHALASQAHLARARSDFASAARLYLEASEQYADAGLPRQHATVLTAAARCLHVDGDTRASAVLATAKDLARKCGATRVQDQIERIEYLLNTGHTPKSGNTDIGVLLRSLTQREHDVAKLAGAGTRTQEIATSLRLSPRTVEVHLTRIYRKLGVTGRAALVRFMAEADSTDTGQP
jgi:DNA-binding NarL/FixJ family response regulator